ncbi:MAG: dockerin type I domain-containing protein [Patescibacteria group bacterium]
MAGSGAKQWIAVTVAGLALWFGPNLPRVQAAGFQYAADYLNRQQADLTGGVVHQLFVMPATGLSGSANSLELTWPDSPDGTWCRVTAGDLTVQPLTNPAGSNESATPMPGPLSASCLPGGVGSGDTIVISGVGPLTAGTKYGLAVADGPLGRLGTPPPAQGLRATLTSRSGPTAIDTIGFFLSTLSNDQFVVSAVVTAAPPPGSGNPSVEFRGLSAPSGQVTVRRDDVVMESVPSDTQATFALVLVNQPTGPHLFVVSGTDRHGRPLAPVTFALNLTPGSTTVISGVFLVPSIGLDRAAVNSGQSVTVFGATAPNSAVTVNVGSDRTQRYTVTADAAGQWSKILDTKNLAAGTYTVKARAAVNGIVSADSAAVSFSVSPAAPAAVYSPADISQDQRVDIVDLSILLFYWNQRHPANPRADLNRDGVVDIIDFSIMLYAWTG